MIKKIINLFKIKKTKKTKKEIKNDKKNNAEIINFVKTAKNKKKIQTEKMEVNKMDDLAKELVENYRVASNKSFFIMLKFIFLAAAIFFLNLITFYFIWSFNVQSFVIKEF